MRGRHGVGEAGYSDQRTSGSECEGIARTLPNPWLESNGLLCEIFCEHRERIHRVLEIAYACASVLKMVSLFAVWHYLDIVHKFPVL